MIRGLGVDLSRTERLRVGLSLRYDPGRSSVDTFVTLERSDQPGEVFAAGGATLVWVDFPRQKSVPLPDWLRQACA